MKYFDSLIYNPKKFIAVAVFLLGILPLYLVGMVSFSANALRDSRPGTACCCPPQADRNPVTGARCEGTQVNCTLNQAGTQANCVSHQAGQSNMNVNSSNTSNQPTNKTVVQRTNVQQPKPMKVVHPITTNTPARTTNPTPPPQRIVRVVSPPARRVVNNVARASATAQAVVNVSGSTPTSASSAASTDNSNSVQTTAAASPTPSTTSTPAVTSAGKSLPNTGPGDVFKLSGLLAIIGSVGHWFYSRRRLI